MTDEFQSLWKQYDNKLERSLKLNQQLLEEIQGRKVRTSFGWAIAFKFMAIVLGIGWNALLGSLLWHFRGNYVFVAASGLIILFTAYSICGYVLQILLMFQINLSKSILTTQKSLAHLEAVIVWTLRVAFLQAPVYAFLFVPRGASVGYWVVLVLVALVLGAVSYWLYRRIRLGNLNGWVKKMVDNEGGKSIARARAFIREIEEYKKEVSE
ncbi:MAG: hypothetical protein JST68_17495 [Bacteroidetes bacterium]|nr:hypothetical protein [Bacteroidota bacterium]